MKIKCNEVLETLSEIHVHSKCSTDISKDDGEH